MKLEGTCTGSKEKGLTKQTGLKELFRTFFYMWMTATASNTLNVDKIPHTTPLQKTQTNPFQHLTPRSVFPPHVTNSLLI